MTDNIEPHPPRRLPQKLGSVVRRVPGDWWGAAGIAVLAFCMAMAYLHATMSFPAPSSLPLFPNFNLTASVSYAAGQGLRPLDVSSVPELWDFLLGKTERFTGSIPSLPRPKTFRFVESHQYLLRAIGLCWRWRGFSWSAIYGLEAALYGVMIAAAYGLFRLGINRGLSLLCTACFACYPSCLGMLMCPRDLSKGPFILLILLICGYLVKNKVNTRVLLGLAAVLGCIIGLGIGFRGDVMIFAPMAAGLLFVFMPWQGLRHIFARAAMVLIIFACTILAGYPVLKASAAGEDDTGLNLLGGFTDTILNLMALDGAPYSLIGQHNDAFIAATAIDYYLQHADAGAPLPDFKTKYVPKQVALRYCIQLAKTFPADLITRVYGSILGVVEAAPADEILYYDIHTQKQKRILQYIADYGAWASAHADAWGRYYAAAALILIAASNLQLGIAALFLFLCFAGYPSLQFGYRHIFHLGFMTLWFPAFVLGCAISWAGRLRNAENRTRMVRCIANPKEWWSLPIKRVVVFSIFSLLVMFGPLGVARVCQHYTVGDLYAALDASELEEIPCEQTQHPLLPHLVMFEAKREPAFLMQPERTGRTDTFSDYLVAEFSNDMLLPTCEIVYADKNKPNTLSLTHARAFEPWSTQNPPLNRFFFPIYETRDEANKFLGIAMRKQYMSCFKGLYKVKNPGQLPMMFTTYLPSDWSQFPRCRTMQPHELPPYIRTAKCFNVLGNGGFEQWNSGVPSGYYPPINALLEKETETVWEGHAALKQTWTRKESTSIFNQFRLEVQDLKPNTRYMFQFQANNLSKTKCSITIYQAVPSENGESLHCRCFPAPIRPVDGFKDYTLLFSTRPEENARVIISVYGNYPDELSNEPFSVIWDDWRLVELGPTPDGFPSEDI
ncbi:MAG TPA: hypothetical protein PLI09_03675 [Candidatus Hydrogenedentes bacterium]|nr:hypothetical protein [Candidatus Hydrogenedentota bacterium]